MPEAFGDDPGYDLLKAKIQSERGFECASYKDTCIRRRINGRMRVRRVESVLDYCTLLDGDTGEYDTLLRALTINVTRFFRNPETFALIRGLIVPDLWSLPVDKIKVWSAGSSSGEEAYSLAILFSEHARAVGEIDRLGRVEIIGTDVDVDCVRAAQAGRYGRTSFTDTPDEIRDRYFLKDGAQWRVSPEIREMATFRESNLLRAENPFGLSAPLRERCHLVICRNVLIYLTPSAQESILTRFHDELEPGGFLILGKVETISGHNRSLFAPVRIRERLYRRGESKRRGSPDGRRDD